jgi:hypothetical protein
MANGEATTQLPSQPLDAAYGMETGYPISVLLHKTDRVCSCVAGWFGRQMFSTATTPEPLVAGLYQPGFRRRHAQCCGTHRPCVAALAYVMLACVCCVMPGACLSRPTCTRPLRGGEGSPTAAPLLNC